MQKMTGLRKRWFINTVGVVCVLGVICVLIITMVFTAYYYSSMESDLHYRAEVSSDFFASYINPNYNDYYQACVDYTKSYEHRNHIELQFIDADGRVLASSYGSWSIQTPTTSDIQDAFESRSISDPYTGRDPSTGERIIAISNPVIYQNGEIIGVLRYVTSTRLIDRQILTVFLMSLGALCIIVLVVLLSSNYYIHSILVPVAEITEKAQRIAGGNYGIQIQKRYNDEIGTLADTINEMSNQIGQNEKVQRDFISSLSHELRTPLTAITGWSETLLAGDTLDPATERGMRIILREGQRLTEMVSDLLDFNRIQDDRITLNYEITDIRGEFEDTVYMYRNRVVQDGIQLIYLDNGEDIPEINCDGKRLRQVFLNILDNAAKHGRDGKRIEASMTLEHNFVVVRIRDYGVGIPEDELSLVKKKFYKGSSKARGTGIGLAICDEIIKMHNGTLWLENAPEGGTLVTVRLPVSQ